MKNLLFLLLTGLICCKQVPAPVPPITEDEKAALRKVMDKDSTTMLDFSRKLKYCDIPQQSAAVLSDSFYRCRISGGWEYFDMLCSVYANTDGHWAEGTQIDDIDPYLQTPGNRIVYSRVKKKITNDQWNHLRREIQRSGFWAMPESYIECIDAKEFRIWGAEGRNAQYLEWSECEFKPSNDSLFQIMCLIYATCGDLRSPPSCKYKPEGDSLLVYVKSAMPCVQLIKSKRYFLSEQLIAEHRDCSFKIHRRDLAQLDSISVVTEWLDGTVLEKRVEHVLKTTK